MNLKNSDPRGRVMISIGLLLVTLTGLTVHYIAIPDFFRGFLIGTGLGLEIIGLIALKKKKDFCLDKGVKSARGKAAHPG